MLSFWLVQHLRGVLVNQIPDSSDYVGIAGMTITLIRANFLFFCLF
ncbi:MAG: hypothetical protein OZ930_09760 [Ignavibacteria bacterium]|nr:hypothetical protein [Ignavibacteria bacterium]